MSCGKQVYAHLGEVKRHGTSAYTDLEYWARHGLKRSKHLKNEDL